MKVVMLERNSLGMDVDVSGFGRFGEFVEYPVSSEEETIERVKDADFIVVNKVNINEKTIGQAKNVKLILETATGVNNIDLEYCKSRGIKVANVAGYSTETVAQHTFALYFYLAEHMPYYDNYVKSGQYGNQPVFTHFENYFNELSGKTWGIVGLGAIGRSVARIASAFGCRVVYYSASGNTYDVPYEAVDFDTLLTESDVISIHAPLNEHTGNLFNKDTIAKMKKSAYLINVGRGPIINDADLKEALDNGVIAGAGLDVLGKEPIEKDNPLGEIMDSDKLIITPHVAWASYEARYRLVQLVIGNGEKYLAGDTDGFVVG